ncbi:MAG: Dna2/Cas4 domain-containing protein [Candidatus Woesearchaeota archaeon]
MIPVSWLAGYIYCPRKLFLEQIKKIIVPKKKEVICNAIKHRAIELACAADESIVSQIISHASLNEIARLYEMKYRRIANAAVLQFKAQLKEANIAHDEIYKQVLNQLLREARHRAERVYPFMCTQKVYGKRLWEKLSPKIKSEYYLESKNLNLCGMIEKLEVYEDFVVPLETKFGKAPKEGTWPGDRIKIAAYIMLLEDCLKVNVSRGIVVYAQEKQERTIVINPFMRQEVVALRTKIENLAQIETLTSNKHLLAKSAGKAKCAACAIRQECFTYFCDGTGACVSSKVQDAHRLI